MITVAISIILLILLSIFSRISHALLFSITTLTFYCLGFVSQETLLQSTVNNAVVSLIMLMVASLALERTRVLTLASRFIYKGSYHYSLFRLGFLSCVISGFLNNTAVVATLMGSIVKNRQIPASKLLIPLSYFAMLGGSLTLIGTSTNLIVNGLLISQGLPELSFFSFTPVGIALCIFVGGTIILLTRFLPTRIDTDDQNDFFIEATVLPHSKLIDKTISGNKLRSLNALFLAEIIRDEQLISPVSPCEIIQANDKLLFCGDITDLNQLKRLNGLAFFAEESGLSTQNLQQVIVRADSILVNKTLKSTHFRSQFDAAVVAIQRNGERLSGKLGEQYINAGDKLIVATGNDFIKRKNVERNFISITPAIKDEQLEPWQEALTILGFLAVLTGAALHIFSLFSGLLFFIIALLMSNILDGATIRRRFPFGIWVIVSCSLCIATVFVKSGLANYLSQQLMQHIGHYSPIVALAIIIIITMFITEVITNNAAAALVLPIAIATAQNLDVSTLPFIMAVAYGASGSFISPYGYQTNLMVMNAGNYRFSDFIKIGWGVSIAYFVVIWLFTPLIFPF